jgi:hypothetical protein
MKKKSLIVLILLVGELCAQKSMVWDTTKYQKFKSNLIIGMFQTYRRSNNHFQQFAVKDTLGISDNDYYAESNHVTGIEINYDKFSLSLGLKSTPPDSKKGDTKTFNANFNFGGNIWYIENAFRYFQGFYDQNTKNYDSTFSETGKYYLQPKLINTILRSKFLYFTNHKKFACRSGYACNYRQRKTASTWIFSANTNYYYLRNDSALFPGVARQFYGGQADLTGLTSFGISLNAGAAANIVLWKALFVNLMFIIGPEQQWRTYHYTNRSLALSYISVSGDFRGSIGVNCKRWYMIWTSQNDFVWYNSSFLTLQNRSLAGSFSFGWRFNSKTPAFYKKFQQTKLYMSI